MAPQLPLAVAQPLPVAPAEVARVADPAVVVAAEQVAQQIPVVADPAPQLPLAAAEVAGVENPTGTKGAKAE